MFIFSLSESELESEILFILSLFFKMWQNEINGLSLKWEPVVFQTIVVSCIVCYMHDIQYTIYVYIHISIMLRQYRGQQCD